MPPLLKSKPALFAAASLFAAGAAAFYYARKVEPKRFKLETVRVITGDGNAWRGRDAQAAGAAGTGLGGREALADSSLGSSLAGKSSSKLSGNGAPHEGNGKKLVREDRAERRVFKILHISDLHLAKPESHKVDFLRKITDAEYDLVVLTGDVFEDESGLEYADKILSRRPRLGAYAVLGNHDYYDYNYFNKIVGRIVKRFRHPNEKRDVTPFIEALQNGGFDVLRNESRCFKGEGLHLVGIDYPGIQPHELMRLAGEAPEHHLKLAIFHLPKKLHHITNAEFHLALGGHTHGGQIRIPGFGPLITDSELGRHEASGLIRRGNTAFHISRGLGADPRSNIRFFCPPAATIVEVHHQMPRGV